MTERMTKGLYDPGFEHDSCGIGFVANIKGRKSHDIIANALSMLESMEHRGACGCEKNTGDGAGILIQTPHEFFVDECLKIGIKLPAYGEYGVGLVFFPQDERQREDCRQIFNRNIEKLGMNLLGYRKLPVNNAEIGPSALAVEPQMEQVFIQRPDDLTDPDAFERKLFVLRNYTTRLVFDSLHLQIPNIKNTFYIASLSYKTIVYKGQLISSQTTTYFPDLQRKELISALALVHARFSTNTFPSFRLAQPFRYIAHNGEINTIKGNVNWMRAQEASFASDYFSKEELEMALPICDPSNSDSANLDNAIELLTLAGRSLPHVMMMLIPEAWDDNEDMPEYKKAFYEYHAALMEPWDGPASICFTDGKVVGATLDRNGLRPSRFLVTDDDIVIMASEAGVLDVDPAKVVKKGRLQPGRMFVVNMEEGRIISDEELKETICSAQPYAEWLKHKIRLEDVPDPEIVYTQPYDETLLKRQLAFGYSAEDLNRIIREMVENSKEPLGAMGNDAPLAVLSDQAQHLSSYFKQLFAQVTNPPIDPIRERLVMSLISYVGGSLNLLEESPKHCRQVELKQPILTNKDLEKLRNLDQDYFQTKTIQAFFKADETPGVLEKALNRICNYASDAVEDGFSIILISNRSIDSSHAPIPSLLATSAVHHHLIRKGLRGKVGIVVEAGDAWEVHHFATLISFGASAVNPYLAFETIVDLKEKGVIKTDAPKEKLFESYIASVDYGLLKVFSKMGISTLQSYEGAQIFEALGISKKVIAKYFTSTVSRIEGLSLDDIAREALIKHRNGFPLNPSSSRSRRIESAGIYEWRRRGEHHLFNPQTIHLLQHSTRMGDYQLFKKYSKLINDQSERAVTLRSLLKFRTDNEPVPLDEVEPIENIFKRFATGAMSFGSISYEAHSTLAIAMNRIGGKSNTGEGGEDEARFERKANGDWERSAIKQVASGRFGVTSNYLTNADELQIKMAQGAKPGEGGQLPGYKVDEWIGRVRHSTPGVGLISPPPHHDIYSIEDLAQLIFDLKNANPAARVNVKLVSEAGVGTIAAGVAKAHADVVLIAGMDGGTGASPISSIRHAGLPWELGIAETHQTLIKNRLRSRIVVQADGQMKTGRDLAIAALLGAEEWGVATAALVTTGCIMMRKCHLNTCPVGVATQNKELRALFTGKPEHVVNLFTFLATELREIMAELGFRTVNEMVGQVDRLTVKDDLRHWKHKGVDLSAILYKECAPPEVGIYHQEAQDHGIDDILDLKLIETARPALEKKESVYHEFAIGNGDRATGTMLSHEISKKYKGAGLPQGTIHYKFNGSAGQSFGAFGAAGIKFELEGEANDYFGKGLSGGMLILYPPKTATFVPNQNIITGNVAFYGATSGEAYIRGQAGERYCVRNSGVRSVVEGVGDHGCEYMTGGVAVILGDTGRNFAAGMSGGIAYVLDEEGTFPNKVNLGSVGLDPMEDEDLKTVKELIENHYKYTKSDVAQRILEEWAVISGKFVKVMPTDYKKVLESRKKVSVQTNGVLTNG